MADTPFIAYAGDCLLHARLELPDGRLSDFLNSTESLSLRDVVVQAHEDGRTVHLERLDIARNEIFAIEATGTRGPRQKRISTRSSRMEFVLGPYRVLGELHTPPGTDEIAALARRKPLVPLTLATIAYQVGTETRLHDVETLIVNRHLIDSIHRDSVDFGFEDMPDAVSLDRQGVRDYSGFLYWE
jgi:hypothetical protein